MKIAKYRREEYPNEWFLTRFTMEQIEKCLDLLEPRAMMLSDLLAIIHRDGGHYERKYGTEKAVKDAIRLSSERIVKCELYDKLMRTVDR
jgi:hypothetical protein